MKKNRNRKCVLVHFDTIIEIRRNGTQLKIIGREIICKINDFKGLLLNNRWIDDYDCETLDDEQVDEVDNEVVGVDEVVVVEENDVECCREMNRVRGPLQSVAEGESIAKEI